MVPPGDPPDDEGAAAEGVRARGGAVPIASRPGVAAAPHADFDPQATEIHAPERAGGSVIEEDALDAQPTALLVPDDDAEATAVHAAVSGVDEAEPDPPRLAQELAASKFLAPHLDSGVALNDPFAPPPAAPMPDASLEDAPVDDLPAPLPVEHTEIARDRPRRAVPPDVEDDTPPNRTAFAWVAAGLLGVALLLGGALALLVLGVDDERDLAPTKAAAAHRPPDVNGANVDAMAAAPAVDDGADDEHKAATTARPPSARQNKAGPTKRSRKAMRKRVSHGKETAGERPRARQTPRAASMARGPRVRVVRFSDGSKSGIQGLATGLKGEVKRVLKKGGATRPTQGKIKRGYSLRGHIQEVRVKKRGGETAVQVDCTLTASAVPGGGMRLNARATTEAAVGDTHGDVDELALDATKACAQAVTGDFNRFVRSAGKTRTDNPRIGK